MIVPPAAIETSISAIGPAVAGYNFSLTCSVTQIEGLVGIPSLVWTDNNDLLVVSTDDVILNDPVTSGLTTSQTLCTDPIRTSDEGIYTCKATLSSSALTTPLNSSATYFVDVQQSKIIIIIIMV